MNWMQIAGLVAFVVCGGGLYGMHWVTSRSPVQADDSPEKPVDHDATAPVGFAEYVQSVTEAAGAKATSEFILAHVRNGSTAAQVMKARIAEMEAAK